MGKIEKRVSNFKTPNSCYILRVSIGTSIITTCQILYHLIMYITVNISELIPHLLFTEKFLVLKFLSTIIHLLFIYPVCHSLNNI